jgi:hypothetical protein
MTSTWMEISLAIQENRHELKLQGPTISQYIEQNGVDSRLFQLNHLNYLDFSKTCLSELSDDLGCLVNLTNLVLYIVKLSVLVTLVRVCFLVLQVKFPSMWKSYCTEVNCKFWNIHDTVMIRIRKRQSK